MIEEIRCSGCGAKIPYRGEVCPYCQRDKSADKKGFDLALGALVFGGGMGYWVGGFKGLLVGLGAGVLLYIVLSFLQGAKGKSQPPEVRTVAGTADIGGMAEKRLSELERLHRDGLISESEYGAKRQRILDEL